MEAHTGKKSFLCEIYDAAFPQNSNLKEYISKHSEEKLFSGEICGPTFSQLSNLKRHFPTLTREKHFFMNAVELYFPGILLSKGKCQH